MAAPLQIARRFLRLSENVTSTFSRSAFVARKDDVSKPNWLKVGLSVGATIAIWVVLIKQHNEDVLEYERRKAEGRI